MCALFALVGIGILINIQRHATTALAKRERSYRLPCLAFPFELGSLAQKALAVTWPHYQQVFQPDDCNRQLVQKWRKTGNASRQERIRSSAQCK